jgi:hypothetical protein
MLLCYRNFRICVRKYRETQKIGDKDGGELVFGIYKPEIRFFQQKMECLGLALEFCEV